MAARFDVEVQARGALRYYEFLDQRARAALREDLIDHLNTRFVRQGKGLGAQRNIVVRIVRVLPGPNPEVTLDMSSSRIPPRTTGNAWIGKSIAITKSMAPRVLRKALLRMVGAA